MAKVALDILIGAQDKASGQLRAVEGSLGGLEKRAGSASAAVAGLGTALAGALTVGAVVAAGRKAVTMFADYETGVKFATSQLNLMGPALDNANRDMMRFGMELSKSTGAPLKEATDGFRALTSAGFDLQGTMGATPGILALSQATLSDVGNSAQLTMAMIRAFGLEADQTNRVVNTLAAGISSSSLELYDLATALPYVAAPAHMLGMSLEETIAALVVLRDRGYKSEQMATGLRMILLSLVAPTADAQRQLKAYGLTAADVDVKGRGLAAVLQTLREHNLDLAGAMKLSEKEAAGALVTLAGASDAYREGTKAVTDTNRAFEIQKQMQDTAAVKWAKIEAVVAEAAITIGGPLADALLEIAGKLDPEDIKKFAEDMVTAIESALPSAIKLTEELGKIAGFLVEHPGLAVAMAGAAVVGGQVAGGATRALGAKLIGGAAGGAAAGAAAGAAGGAIAGAATGGAVEVGGTAAGMLGETVVPAAAAGGIAGTLLTGVVWLGIIAGILGDTWLIEKDISNALAAKAGVDRTKELSEKSAALLGIHKPETAKEWKAYTAAGGYRPSATEVIQGTLTGKPNAGWDLAFARWLREQPVTNKQALHALGMGRIQTGSFGASPLGVTAPEPMDMGPDIIPNPRGKYAVGPGLSPVAKGQFEAMADLQAQWGRPSFNTPAPVPPINVYIGQEKLDSRIDYRVAQTAKVARTQ